MYDADSKTEWVECILQETAHMREKLPIKLPMGLYTVQDLSFFAESSFVWVLSCLWKTAHNFGVLPIGFWLDVVWNEKVFYLFGVVIFVLSYTSSWMSFYASYRLVIVILRPMKMTYKLSVATLGYRS